MNEGDGNTYHLNVILDPTLNEAQLQNEKDAIASQIARVSGEVVSLDEWGLKRLAYPIRKASDGYYLIYTVRIANNPKALETGVRLRDNVMRVLVVRDRPEWRTRTPKGVARDEAVATA